MKTNAPSAWRRASATNENAPDPTATRGLTPDNDLVGHSEPVNIVNPFGKRQHYAKPMSDLVGSTLPREVVEEIGFRTRKGNIKYDLCHLARAYHLYTRYKDVTEPLTYRQGFVVEQYEWEFIASIQSFAETEYRRLFKSTLFPDNTIVGHPTFEQFLQSTYKDFDRRVTTSGYLYDLGQAASEDIVMGKGRDLLGKRWSMAGCPIDNASERLTADPPLPLVLCALPPDEKALEADSIAAMSYCEGLVAYEYQLHRAFTHGLSWYGVGTPWRKTKWHSWQVTKTQRHEALRKRAMHISIGAFRENEVNPLISEIKKKESAIVEGALKQRFPYRYSNSKKTVKPPEGLNFEEDAQREVLLTDLAKIYATREVQPLTERSEEIKRRRACIMPYLIAEIDARDALSSYTYATQLIVNLQRLGADLSQVIVSYSGNRSFHVRIPMGMVGNPIFASTHEATRITREFFSLITAELTGSEGPLFGVLDPNKFSPNQLIRAVGSIHEKTGRYCVGFYGDEFLKTPLWKVEAYSDVYSPIKLPDPTEASLVPELVSALQLASEDSRDTHGERAVNRGVIARILQGVEKSEEFAPGYAGRNFASLLLSTYLLQRYPEEEAWKKLWDWNRKNAIPLGEHSSDDKNELLHQFERAKARLGSRPHSPLRLLKPSNLSRAA